MSHIFRARRGTGVIQALLLACCAAHLPQAAASDTPRLVLQITVDALRGNLVQRHVHNMGKGG